MLRSETPEQVCLRQAEWMRKLWRWMRLRQVSGENSRTGVGACVSDRKRLRFPYQGRSDWQYHGQGYE